MTIVRGGSAVTLFARWKQKVLLGASLRIVAPTGQHNPTKVINWGINRWAWVLDGYAGVWFYTTNPAAPGTGSKQQTEDPIGALEGHLSYDFKPGTWASLDGNFWWGGLTRLSGIQNLDTKQVGSRLGGTIAWRYAKHQSLKFSYSSGTFSRFGGNYNNVAVAWQYSWIGLPTKK